MNFNKIATDDSHQVVVNRSTLNTVFFIQRMKKLLNGNGLGHENLRIIAEFGLDCKMLLIMVHIH